MPKWSVVAAVFVNINLPPWYLRYQELHRDPHHPNRPWLNWESRARMLGDICIAKAPKGIDFEQLLREEALSQDLGIPSGTDLRRPPPPEPRSPPGETAGASPGASRAEGEKKAPGGREALLHWVAESNRAPVPMECHQESRYPDEDTVTGAVLLPSLRCLQLSAGSCLTASTQVRVDPASAHLLIMSLTCLQIGQPPDHALGALVIGPQCPSKCKSKLSPFPKR